jgi:HEAT repeat protein
MNKIRTIKDMEKLGDKRAIPYLKKILENKKEHEKVRQAAEKVIESLSK